jgi:acyl carrier protein
MEQEVVKILNEIRPEFDFKEHVNFIEEGMLDSFDIIRLVVELDNKFGISIDGVDILPNNFSSVDKIVALLIKNGAKNEFEVS